jgi:hypothetical protein
MRPILYLIVADEEALVQCTTVPVPGVPVPGIVLVHRTGTEPACLQPSMVPESVTVPVVHKDEADACPVISDRYFRDSVDLNADFSMHVHHSTKTMAKTPAETKRAINLLLL